MYNDGGSLIAAAQGAASGNKGEPMVEPTVAVSRVSWSDVQRLRDVVRASDLALCLVELPACSFVEISASGRALIGGRSAESLSGILAAVAVDPSWVRRGLELMAVGALDAFRIQTTLSSADCDGALSMAVRSVGREDDRAYALVVFDASDVDQDADLAPILSNTNRDRLADLERRFRRIAQEIDAVGVFEPLCHVTDLGEFPELDGLTARQSEILMRLLEGERVLTISRGVHLAASTVRNHLTAIYRKVGVHSQAELIERLHAPAAK